MKTIDLRKGKVELADVIKIARQEPVLIVAPDGSEFCMAEADDFEKEVTALRSSQAFQQFLDQRSASPKTHALEDIESEIDRELSNQGKDS